MCTIGGTEKRIDGVFYGLCEEMDDSLPSSFASQNPPPSTEGGKLRSFHHLDSPRQSEARGLCEKIATAVMSPCNDNPMVLYPQMRFRCFASRFAFDYAQDDI